MILLASIVLWRVDCLRVRRSEDTSRDHGCQNGDRDRESECEWQLSPVSKGGVGRGDRQVHDGNGWQKPAPGKSCGSEEEYSGFCENGHGACDDENDRSHLSSESIDSFDVFCLCQTQDQRASQKPGQGEPEDRSEHKADEGSSRTEPEAKNIPAQCTENARRYGQ